MVRLTLRILPFLLFLSAISWAQPSSPVEASPGAMASPAAGSSTNVMGDPQMAGPCPNQRWSGFYPRRHRGVLIVGLVLRSLLTLSAIFALTALGIFLNRRSRPRP
jgi:hypothetical protein